MAAPLPNTDPPHWFWRGVQSAIFYYVSCSPCMDARHKYQRRKEAKLAKHEVVTQQPGLVQQPRAFETNQQWTEEVLLGPGPPKGWEPHAILRKAKKKSNRPPSEDTEHDEARSTRPGHERRISNALENMKGSFRNSLYPENWNWKRYDREDEFLGGIQTTMTRMWDKMTASVGHQTEDVRINQGLKRAPTAESEKIDYTRGHYPAINDMHPPTVSQLPVTAAEAAWMILPPPSAAVMAGKKPPGEETGPRIPLCIIGRPPEKTLTENHGNFENGGNVEADNIEVWDAASVSSGRTTESTGQTPPPTQPPDVKRRIPSMFDALSDTEMFKAPIRPTPRSRPHSWQFTYVIPSTPPPVHIQ